MYADLSHTAQVKDSLWWLCPSPPVTLATCYILTPPMNSVLVPNHHKSDRYTAINSKTPHNPNTTGLFDWLKQRLGPLGYVIWKWSYLGLGFWLLLVFWSPFSELFVNHLLQMYATTTQLAPPVEEESYGYWLKLTLMMSKWENLKKKKSVDWGGKIHIWPVMMSGKRRHTRVSPFASCPLLSWPVIPIWISLEVSTESVL